MATQVQTNSSRVVAVKSGERKQAKRFPMTAAVYPTGRTLLNVTAYAGLKRVALKKGLTTEFHVILAVNEAVGTVALSAVSVETPDAMKVRELETGALSVSLDEALDELPGLRPVNRVKCSATELVDDKGERADRQAGNGPACSPGPNDPTASPAGSALRP